ncbi:MAG: peptidylprolyl isomerase [Methyloprofundus sp.]|nr:peptidylprolyl isomerase [Methyloprofundus sp.]
MIKKHLSIILLSLWLYSLISLASAQSTVDIQTNRGLITVQLADDVAPVTVNNFLSYVDADFYENTLFHRVIDGFMIQAGGFDTALELKEVNAPIILETNVGLSNVRGSIAMARRTEPNTASSQFFINVVDNLFLDYQSFSSPGYAVFGEVIEGMDIVDAISTEATSSVSIAMGLMRDIPQTSVIIEAVRRREGQLSFNDMQATYTAGDTIEVGLEETMTREKALDLWAAVLTEEGTLLYVTDSGFSPTPGAFMAAVPVDKTSHSIFSLTVPQGLTGHFTLFAIFNEPDVGIEDLSQSLRSNIAKISVDLVQ